MIEYVPVEQARAARGLRVVMVGGVPSPWGEAAKGILHTKGIDYTATRMGAEQQAVLEWTGQNSAPIAVYEDEAPRTGWAEILLLAERLAPAPSLIPSDAGERALCLGLSHEICGEEGLGWSRRMAGVHLSLTTGEGYPKRVADYLGAKYGYRGDNGEAAERRVVELLGLLAGRLRAQRDTGSDYYLGRELSVVDIYSAAFMALFDPLPPEQCAMPDVFRGAFAAMPDSTRQALDPVLLEHRDRTYERHLELPLTL